MDRLTFYENDNCSFNIDQDFSMEESKGYWLKIHLDLEKAIYKLGQLEDIEEELVIDLITLHKALKNGIYIKEYDEEGKPLIHIVPCCVKMFTKENIMDFPNKKIWGLQVARLNFKLTDYGKTWALSKEELEKRNNE